MSLESSIAALTQQAGLLMDLPAQVNTAAQVQIAAMGAAYQGRLANLAVAFYVNQASGLDTNPGTLVAPFKSVEKALELTPRGGICTVYLTGPYLMDRTIVVDGRHLELQSASSIKHALSFERYVEAFGGATLYRGMRNFFIQRLGSIAIRDLTIVVPQIDGNWGSYPLHGLISGIVGVSGSGAMPIGQVVLGYVDITIGAAPFSHLIGSVGNPIMVNAFAVVSGASLNGRWFEGITAPGGTASTTLPWLVTNLATV